MLAAKLIERPAIDIGEGFFQHRQRLSLPLGKRGHEILELENQHPFKFRVSAAAASLFDFLELPDGLQTHFGVADLGGEAGDVAKTTVLFPKQSAPNLFADETEPSPRFFQMFTHFVDR